MLKEQIVTSLKMSIGVVIAILLAKVLNLEFYSSVTTVVIVTMLSTKKQSIRLSINLLFAAILSLGLAYLLFTLFGFSLVVFAVYILIFTFLMYRFDNKSSIIKNVLLVMQIYSLRDVSLSILLNQFELMVLGISVALSLNVFTVDTEGELIDYQKQVEHLFNSIFRDMGRCLNNECEKERVEEQLEQLETLLNKSRDRAYNYLNSYYIKQNNYYLEYFIMRRQQYQIVMSMQAFIKLKFLEKVEVKLLREFTDDFVNNTKVLNSCQVQISQLDEIKYRFIDGAELITTKQQLENRIALHQYIYSLVNLVELEMRFIESYAENDCEVEI